MTTKFDPKNPPSDEELTRGAKRLAPLVREAYILDCEAIWEAWQEGEDEVEPSEK